VAGRLRVPFCRRRGSDCGEAGDVDEALDVIAPLIDGFDHVRAPTWFTS